MANQQSYEGGACPWGSEWGHVIGVWKTVPRKQYLENSTWKTKRPRFDFDSPTDRRHRKLQGACCANQVDLAERVAWAKVTPLVLVWTDDDPFGAMVMARQALGVNLE